MVSHDDMFVITVAAVAMPYVMVALPEVKAIVMMPRSVNASLTEMETIVAMPPVVALAEVKTVVTMISIPVTVMIPVLVPISVSICIPVPISVVVAGIVAENRRVPIVLARNQIVVVVALRTRRWRAGSNCDPCKGGDAQHFEIIPAICVEQHSQYLLGNVWILSRVRPALPQRLSPRGQTAGVVARGIGASANISVCNSVTCSVCRATLN